MQCSDLEPSRTLYMSGVPERGQSGILCVILSLFTMHPNELPWWCRPLEALWKHCTGWWRWSKARKQIEKRDTYRDDWVNGFLVVFWSLVVWQPVTVLCSASMNMANMAPSSESGTVVHVQISREIGSRPWTLSKGRTVDFCTSAVKQSYFLKECFDKPDVIVGIYSLHYLYFHHWSHWQWRDDLRPMSI